MFSFHRWGTAAAGSGRRRLLGALAALSLAAPGIAGAAVLQALDFSTREGDSVVITLTLSQPVAEPKVFTLDKPARLSLDLPNTSLALPERLKKINVGKVRSVASAEADGRSRIVVFLSEPVTHQVRVSGNKIILELGSPPVAVAAAPVRAPERVREAVPADASEVIGRPFVSRFSGMDFRRGDHGEARVIVTLSNPQTQVDVREEAGNVVANFKDVMVGDGSLRRYDVLDFATPAKYVDVRRAGSDVQVVVTPVGEFEQVAYQTGNTFTLELQPLTQEKIDQKKRTEPTFNGEKISLSFQNIDVRALLQIIADVANVNMVVSDEVKGEMAMRLQNVPWDQALDIILRSKGLGQRREGNVIQVATLGQIAERDKAEFEVQKQSRELAPLRSEIIQVNYAKALDLAALIKSKDASQLSERGTVSVDDRTNSLLVLETRDKIAEIRELVARLDIPVRQVLIESRIVIANDNFSRELGTRFGVSAIAQSGSTLFGTSGNIENAVIPTQGGGAPPIGITGSSSTTGSTGGTGSSGSSSGGGTQGLSSHNGRLNFSLPAGGNAGGLALAVLGRNFLVDLELSALQTEGRGEVISSPHVVTATGRAAVVEQGTEIPFSSSSGNTGTTTQFKKATLALEVTPFITPDDRVQMDLNVKSDAIGQNVSQATGGSAPAIDTRRVTTSLLVNNGDTVVLGGVYERDNNKSADKIPLLGDLPLLGSLFKHNLTTTKKTELLIFVTPKILKEGIRVN